MQSTDGCLQCFHRQSQPTLLDCWWLVGVNFSLTDLQRAHCCALLTWVRRGGTGF